MKKAPMSFLIRTAAALSIVFGLSGAVAAQGLVDDDRDRVSDDVDQCLDTPEGEIVGSDGCSVCPCDGTLAGDDWASHDAYVQCVVDAAKAGRRSRTLSRRQAKAAVRFARKASCGNPELTRCCVYPDNADELDEVVGTCRITSVDECDQLIDTKDWAEDLDVGSCVPNPCIF